MLGKELALPSMLRPARSTRGDDVGAIAFGLNAVIIILGVGLLLGAAGSALTIRRFLQV